jgi:hypothetical protein
LHKALVTVYGAQHQFYGLDWDAYPMRYEDYMAGRRISGVPTS